MNKLAVFVTLYETIKFKTLETYQLAQLNLQTEMGVGNNIVLTYIIPFYRDVHLYSYRTIFYIDG
jgi:hypothetical protein